MRLPAVPGGNVSIPSISCVLSLPFEFVIDGPPVSQQARRRERVQAWKSNVYEVAAQFWPSGELPVTELCMLTITYFFEGSTMDVDNIPKPIIDALKGLVYMDDSQLTDVLCRKRDLNANLRVINPSPVLAEGFEHGKEFLYIVIEPAPDQTVIR